MKKTIELAQVRQGEVFEVAGERFVRLSEEQCGAILVLREDVLPGDCAFNLVSSEEEECNRYAGSDLHNQMLSWISIELLDAAEPRPIDLTTMDGMTDYGMPELRVRALTVMEYQRYRRYIPLVSRQWWTATGETTPRSQLSSDRCVWSVDPDGTLRRSCAYLNSFAARPALYIKSSAAVTVECEGGGKELKDYTDRELLAELARRDDARHTVTARG